MRAHGYVAVTASNGCRGVRLWREGASVAADDRPTAGDGVFGEMDAGEHEQVLWCRHEPSGLRAVIALHSTALGPALGGTPFKPYASEGEALHDVLRLSRGMTYKNAAAGLDLGGGKAVIIGDPRQLRSETLF